MRFLDLKVPPPIVALIAALLMWLTGRAAPAFTFPFPAHRVVASCLALAGVTAAVLGVVSFRRVGTTVNPMRPEKSSALVTSGIFKLTRNPMYLGLLLVLLGWTFFLSNALAFLFLPAFVLYMTRFQIAPEETALASMFGQEFLTYKTQVRRWL